MNMTTIKIEKVFIPDVIITSSLTRKHNQCKSPNYSLHFTKEFYTDSKNFQEI